MIHSTYNLCLLYISSITLNQFDMSIVSMQTDDTLILADQSFAIVEDEAIISAKIMIKAREQSISDNSLKFNGTRIERLGSVDQGIIYYRQEAHIQGIQLIQSIESTSLALKAKCVSS